MDRELLKGRLEGGLWGWSNEMTNVVFKENHKESSLPYAEYHPKRMEGHTFILLFKHDDKNNKVFIEYRTPNINIGLDKYNLKPYNREVQDDLFRVDNEFIKELLNDFVAYSDAWIRGIKYITLNDRNYINGLANYQAKILEKALESTDLSKNDSLELKQDTRVKLIENIESFLKISYIDIDNGALRFVYTSDVDSARKLIRRIVDRAFESIEI